MGDLAKVHSPLVELELEGAAAPAPEGARAKAVVEAPSASAVGRGATGRPEAARLAPDEEPAAGAGGEGAHRAAGQKALATPAVRALARELGIDVNAVAGSGPGGRVTKDDIAAFRRGTDGHGRPELRAAPVAERAPVSRAPAEAAPSPSPSGRRRAARPTSGSRCAACASASPRTWRARSGPPRTSRSWSSAT